MGVFADSLAGSLVIRFMVITPSLLLLMLFIVSVFLWNRAKAMLMLVPGMAIGGYAVSHDTSLTDQIQDMLGIIVAVMIGVACFAGYGIANDRCRCCGNQRGRLETITYLVTGGMSFACMTVSVVLSKSMWWRLVLLSLLFLMKL